MAKHFEAAAGATSATNSAVGDAAQGAMPAPVWQWSISEAWSWLGHAWTRAIHVPYLGLIVLVFAFAVVVRALVKLLR
jgi:hypothetical protein